MHRKHLIEKRLNYSQLGRAHASKITRTQAVLYDHEAPVDHRPLIRERLVAADVVFAPDHRPALFVGKKNGSPSHLQDRDPLKHPLRFAPPPQERRVLLHARPRAARKSGSAPF
jgi:hypothetical protein